MHGTKDVLACALGRAEVLGDFLRSAGHGHALDAIVAAGAEGPQPDEDVEENADAEAAQLLREVRVFPLPDAPAPPGPSPSERSSTDEVLHDVVLLLCNRARLALGRESASNVLAAGAQPEFDVIGWGWPNTTLAALHGPGWEALLAAVGPPALRHLLAHCALFLALPRGCFLQLAGPPLKALAEAPPRPPAPAPRLPPRPLGPSPATNPSAAAETPAELAEPAPAGASKAARRRPSKRKRDRARRRAAAPAPPRPRAGPASRGAARGKAGPANRRGGAAPPAQEAPPRAGTVDRSPMLFSCTFVPRSGLPLSHALNRLPPSPRGARALARLVFSAPAPAPAPTPAPRQGPRARRRLRLPRRLVPAVPLLRALLRRQRAFPYRRALERACPLPPPRPLPAAYASQEAGADGEEGAGGGEGAGPGVRGLLGAHTPWRRVAAFLKVAPAPPLEAAAAEGTGRRRRLEALAGRLRWLRAERGPGAAGRAAAAAEAAHRLVAFLLRDFARAAAAMFYVTEAEGHRQRLFYYARPGPAPPRPAPPPSPPPAPQRKPLWAALKRAAVASLLGPGPGGAPATFRLLPPAERRSVLAGRRLGYGFARFVPKPAQGTLRTIANLSRRPAPRPAAGWRRGELAGGLAGASQAASASLALPSLSLRLEAAPTRPLAPSTPFGAPGAGRGRPAAAPGAGRGRRRGGAGLPAGAAAQSERQPEAFGGSVFGAGAARGRLLAFKAALLEAARRASQGHQPGAETEAEGEGEGEPPRKRPRTGPGPSTPAPSSSPPSAPFEVYACTVDAEKSFDRLRQARILELLEEFVPPDVEEYIIVRYTATDCRPGARGPFTRYCRRAVPADEGYPDFPRLARELAVRHPRSVLADQVVYKRVRRGDALALAAEHLSASLLLLGPQLAAQQAGIPQGSLLSSLLCWPAPRPSHPRGRLAGFPDYGVSSNPAKAAPARPPAFDPPRPRSRVGAAAQARFAGPPSGPGRGGGPPRDGDGVRWNGLVVHPGTLEVTRDYSRYEGACMRDTLRVPALRPGLALRRRILAEVRLRSRILELDGRLNSKRTAVAHALELPRVNGRFLARALLAAARAAHRLLRRQVERASPPGRFPLPPRSVEYLACAAFVAAALRSPRLAGPRRAYAALVGAASRSGWAARASLRSD
eukprot:tig00021616_g22924.t1